MVTQLIVKLFIAILFELAEHSLIVLAYVPMLFTISNYSQLIFGDLQDEKCSSKYACMVGSCAACTEV